MPHRRSTRIIGILFGGRRGAVLILLGFIFFLIGLGLEVEEMHPASRAALYVALTIAPASLWGGVFMAVGVLSALNSRWPTGQKVGYALLTGLSVFWSAVYVGGVLRGAPGSYRGLLAWAALATLTLIISGWSEVPYRPKEPTK